MLALRHVGRVLAGLVAHAVRTRRIGVLLLVVVAAIVLVVTVAAQLIGPIALYPFL